MLALQETVSGSPWQWLAVLLALLGEGLALVFVVRVLSRGGAPASTLLWVVVILLAPWFGLFLYYLFPRRLQLRRLRRLRRQLERWRGGVGPARTGASLPAGAPDPTEQPLRRLLREIAPADVSLGNSVRWVPGGAEFFTAAAVAIESARSFVHLEVYIFRPDATGIRFLELLAAAARRGVAVRLLYDSFGSFGLKAAHLAALRAAGGRAEAFLPLLWKRRPFTVNLRNHRKLLVVDGEVAFLGGRNVGDEYATDRFGNRRAWLDAMVSVRGPGVADLHHVFAEDWFNATDEELVDGRWFPEQPPAGSDCVGVVGSGPDRDVQELWFTIFQAIGEARVSIDLSSPYLVPPPTLLFALVVAAARGVRVRIFTNGPASAAIILYHAQRSYYRELIAAGIEVWETQSDYNHAKVLVVDNRSVFVGSANMDLRSASWNFEIAVAMPDSPALAAAVLQTLAERSGDLRRVAEPEEPPALRRLVDGTCRVLSPLL